MDTGNPRAAFADATIFIGVINSRESSSPFGRRLKIRPGAGGIGTTDDDASNVSAQRRAPKAEMDCENAAGVLWSVSAGKRCRSRPCLVHTGRHITTSAGAFTRYGKEYGFFRVRRGFDVYNLRSGKKLGRPSKKKTCCADWALSSGIVPRQGKLVTVVRGADYRMRLWIASESRNDRSRSTAIWLRRRGVRSLWGCLRDLRMGTAC